MTSYHYAVKTLVGNRVNSLPVTGELLKEMLGRLNWEIVFFDLDDEASTRLLRELSILEFAEKYKAFSLQKDEFRIVFVKKGLATDTTNYLLAHELGHIVMGHFSDTGILEKHNGCTYDEQQESDADEFARNILAPICILKKMHIKSIDELEQYTSLKNEALKAHYTEYKNYRAVLDESEHTLIGNFNNYIKNHTRPNKKKKLLITTLSVFLVLFFSVATYRAVTYSNKNSTGDSIPTLIQQPITQEKSVDGENNQNINKIETTDQKITINGIDYNKNLPVFKTQTGSKIHKENCKHIVGRSGVTQITLESAIAAGIEPCKDCF